MLGDNSPPAVALTAPAWSWSFLVIASVPMRTWVSSVQSLLFLLLRSYIVLFRTKLPRNGTLFKVICAEMYSASRMWH